MTHYTDPASGRQYYIDPVTGESRWVEERSPGRPVPGLAPQWPPPPAPMQGQPARSGRGAQVVLWGLGGLVVLALVVAVASLASTPRATVQPLADAPTTTTGTTTTSSGTTSTSGTGAVAGDARSRVVAAGSTRATAASGSTTRSTSSSTAPTSRSVAQRAGTSSSTTTRTTTRPVRTTTMTTMTTTTRRSSSACDPNYSGACVPIASDVDCAGGSGNGPAYVQGPFRVVGRDIYRLDADHDGIACE